ncbi:MAG: VWA domain-containing protein [Thermoclostridium sp.]|nr:VWA domain-containing protein [Thermoclostridium sp.]
MQIGITFDNLWVMVLFPVFSAFIIITAKKLRLGSAFKKRAIPALRVLLIFVLLLAVAAPEISSKAKKTATIFIADLSDSVRGKKNDMDAFISEAVSRAESRDITGLIAFADESRVIRMPQDKAGYGPLPDRMQSDGTDIEKAMLLARSITPEDAAKRLVLLSDGKETKGEALQAARLLKRLGYTLDVVAYNDDDIKEVQIEAFSAPKQVNAKERFDVSMKIISNVQTKATVRLFGNRTLTAEKEVDLYPGENLFTFSDKVDEGGMVSYTAEVVATDDTVLQNNALSAFTVISDHPRILLVERGNRGENLVRYLEQYAQITRSQPDEVPTSLSGLLAYDAFILADISAEWLNTDFMNLLEQAVQHQGKGLLTIGGENSYAPGGYNDTPLETILPVEMDIRPKEENPDLGLILVIDKSGSMTGGNYGITKLELAKEAAIRAAEVLEERDQLGVIAFDDAIQWVIRTEPLTSLKEATDLIGTIRPGGGTQILHPLEEAWQNLRTKDTKLKHIILLTDGQAEQYGYERIIDGVREDGITLSTVAVGEGADTLLLKALAYGGQGRYYQTDEFSDIPSIFAKEAFLAGQKYLQNRQFYPELVTSMGLLKGIEAVPPLDGYVATRVKPAAHTIFRSDIQDPVLATWQYGLGRTAAWTSDIQGIWTSQWAMWQDAPVFWGNLAGWLVQKNLNTDYTVETRVADGKGVVTVQAETDSILYEASITGTVVSPDGTKETIELNAVRPGTFEGTINQSNPGAYVVHLEVPGENGVESVSAGVVMPYSDEYRLLDANAAGFLEKLAQTGGGRMITDPSEVFKGEIQNTGARRDLTYALILAALILLLLDIALRKLQIPLEPIILFVKEKIVAPTANIVKELKKPKKTAVIAPTGSRAQDMPEEPPAAEKPAESEPKGPSAAQKSNQIKPSSPKEEPVNDSKDHINALLNRRKQWK